MSELMRRQWKRQRYPVVMGEGDDQETVYLRAMTYAEMEESDALETNRTFFNLGCCLVDDSGKPAFPRKDGESAVDYAARAIDFFRDVPSDTLMAMADRALKLRREPKLEAVVKN